MVKLWVELWRDGLSREAFLERLAGDHASAVAAGAEALGVRRAVLNRRITAPEIDAFSDDRGWAPAGDAMVELWFDDVAAFEAALGSTDGREALAGIAAVEREIADTSRSSAVLTREHVVFDLFRQDAPRAADEAERAARVKLVVQNQGHPSSPPSARTSCRSSPTPKAPRARDECRVQRALMTRGAMGPAQAAVYRTGIVRQRAGERQWP